MEALRILHVIPWITSGGVEKRHVLLARHIAEMASGRPVEHAFFCLRGAGPLFEEVRVLGCPTKQAGRNWSFRDLEALVSLRRWLRSWRPNVIHAGVYEAVVLASAARAGTGIKLILEEIDYPLTRSLASDFLMARLFSSAEAAIAVSRPVHDYLRDKLRVPAQRLNLVENAIEPLKQVAAETMQAMRRQLNASPDDFVLTSVGRLHDGLKRVSDAISSLGFCKTKKRIHLVVVGDGPDRPGLEQLAAETRTDRRLVHFLGYQRDVAPILKASDAFISLSTRESFGQAIVEAMAASLPVIATPTGGPGTIVQSCMTGFLVPAGEPEAAAAAVDILVEDAELRRLMGRRAWKRSHQYTASRYLHEIENIYFRVADELCDSTKD